MGRRPDLISPRSVGERLIGHGRWRQRLEQGAADRLADFGGDTRHGTPRRPCHVRCDHPDRVRATRGADGVFEQSILGRVMDWDHGASSKNGAQLGPCGRAEAATSRTVPSGESQVVGNFRMGLVGKERQPHHPATARPGRVAKGGRNASFILHGRKAWASGSAGPRERRRLGRQPGGESRSRRAMSMRRLRAMVNIQVEAAARPGSGAAGPRAARRSTASPAPVRRPVSKEAPRRSR